MYRVSLGKFLKLFFKGLLRWLFVIFKDIRIVGLVRGDFFFLEMYEVFLLGVVFYFILNKEGNCILEEILRIV